MGVRGAGAGVCAKELPASRASAARVTVIRSLIIGVPETFIIVYPRAGVKVFHVLRAIQSLAYGSNLALIRKMRAVPIKVPVWQGFNSAPRGKCVQLLDARQGEIVREISRGSVPGRNLLRRGVLRTAGVPAGSYERESLLRAVIADGASRK